MRTEHRRLLTAFLFALLGMLGSTFPSRAAEGRVELELVTVGNFPFEETRNWIEALKKLDLDGVRIRSGSADDKPEIVTAGTERSPLYKVTGILTPGGNMILPGGKFKISDRAGIGRWMEKVKAGGPEQLTAKVGAFGLYPKQLAAVHEALAGSLEFSTAGGEPAELVKKITDKLPLKVTLDSAADKGLAAGEPFGDELIGLSSGTALAAVLRPCGLVFVPVKGKGDEVELRITDSRSVEKSWPVGWPSEKAKGDLLPDFFKTLSVEITDTPLAESLATLQGRVKTPFLFDYNSLARQRIDLQTKIDLPKINTSYTRIIDRLLNQAKLRSEVRVDEADHPFLWITTIK